MSLIITNHARSWLLASGSHADTFAYLKSRTSTDVVILDLEDGVPDYDKSSARENVTHFLSHARPLNVWVRVNPPYTNEWEADLNELSSSAFLGGVVLSKCESPIEVEDTAKRLGPETPIIPLVETALGLERSFEIAASPQAVRLAFGIGDFRRDAGVGADPLSLAYARGRLVTASRAVGIAAPIDGPAATLNPETLSEEVEMCRQMGMTGKLCLRGEQIPYINRGFRPSADEILWAHNMIDGPGRQAGHVHDGSYRPQLARARNILRLVSVFESLQSDEPIPTT